MPDFLTRRDGTWHFVRRVPQEFARVDARGIIRHSTKVRVRDDRTVRRAMRVAERFNTELEAFWTAAVHGPAREQAARYDAARHCARTLGFEYVENDQLLRFPIERLLERLETLVGKRIAEQPVARAAVLGTERRPVRCFRSSSRSSRGSLGMRSKPFPPSSFASGATLASGPLRSSLRAWATSRGDLLGHGGLLEMFDGCVSGSEFG